MSACYDAHLASHHCLYFAESIFLCGKLVFIIIYPYDQTQNPNQKPMLSMMSTYCEHIECVCVYELRACYAQYAYMPPIRVRANNLIGLDQDSRQK